MTFNQVVRGSSPRWLTIKHCKMKVYNAFFYAQNCKSLPKSGKSVEKVENPMIYHLQFTNSNTIYARNRTVYAKGVFVH